MRPSLTPLYPNDPNQPKSDSINLTAIKPCNPSPTYLQKERQSPRAPMATGTRPSREHRPSVSYGTARPARGHQQSPGGHRVRPRRHRHHGQRELPQGAGLSPGGNQRPAPQHVCRSGLPRERGIQAVLARPQRRQIPGRGIQAHRQGRQGSLDSGLVQPDLRSRRQAVQGRQVRHRRHGARNCRTPTTRARSPRSARPRR